MSITPYANEPLDIVILAGQSNMEGNGVGGAEDCRKPNEKILVMNGEIATRVEKKPYGNAYLIVDYSPEYTISVADQVVRDGRLRYSLALTFADLYEKERLFEGRRLLLVQSSVGGTGFAKGHWGEGEPLFERMLDMTATALKMNPDNRIVAFLWHQGEHDAYEGADTDPDELKASYKQKLGGLIKLFRDRFGEQPFLAAGFSRGWVPEYPKQNEAVNTATAELCNELPNAAFISDTSDLSVNDELVGDGDTVHFSRPALITLGQRYYSAYKSLLRE